MKTFLETVLHHHEEVCLEKDYRNMTMIDEAIHAKNNPLIDMLFKHETKRYFKYIEQRLMVVRSML